MSISWVSIGHAYCPRCKELIEPGQEVWLKKYKYNDCIEHVDCKWKKKSKHNNKKKKVGNVSTITKDKRVVSGGLPEMGKRA